ncbi:hypothetical protein AVEN_53350-1 [Araneus ventricosus]|uniref:Uncharacterized protein n=1 Tax=Araneus ventricosus TaxID=182803 RepID=A0A4Y2AAC4_ARAVE|nr:hypothetical protein AVEN_53350-1 [Araneus ventricosus]
MLAPVCSDSGDSTLLTAHCEITLQLIWSRPCSCESSSVGEGDRSICGLPGLRPDGVWASMDTVCVNFMYPTDVLWNRVLNLRCSSQEVEILPRDHRDPKIV